MCSHSTRELVLSGGRDVPSHAGHACHVFFVPRLAVHVKSHQFLTPASVKFTVLTHCDSQL
jgi:hypothetical protein